MWLRRVVPVFVSAWVMLALAGTLYGMPGDSSVPDPYNFLDDAESSLWEANESFLYLAESLLRAGSVNRVAYFNNAWGSCTGCIGHLADLVTLMAQSPQAFEPQQTKYLLQRVQDLLGRGVETMEHGLGIMGRGKLLPRSALIQREISLHPPELAARARAANLRDSGTQSRNVNWVGDARGQFDVARQALEAGRANMAGHSAAKLRKAAEMISPATHALISGISHLWKSREAKQGMEANQGSHRFHVKLVSKAAKLLREQHKFMGELGPRLVESAREAERKGSSGKRR